MDYYIKQNSELPKIQFTLIKDGRSDYNLPDDMNNSSVFFSMFNPHTNQYVSVNKPVEVIDDHTLSIQLTKKETKKTGTYVGEFKVTSSEGVLITPIKTKLNINILESVGMNDVCCKTNIRPINDTNKHRN
jgi:hypothetical protein